VNAGHRWDGDTLVLALRVQPRARRDQWCGPDAAGRLRVRLTAPPLEGRANAHLVKFLAGLFGVPRARVRLLAGERGRDKRLAVEAPARLPAGIAPPPASPRHC